MYNKNDKNLQILELTDDGLEYINSNFTVDKKDHKSFDGLIECFDFKEILLMCYKDKV